VTVAASGLANVLQYECSKLRAGDVLVVEVFLAPRQVNLTNRMIGQNISHCHIVEKSGDGGMRIVY
jgi:hypothetical protein